MTFLLRRITVSSAGRLLLAYWILICSGVAVVQAQDVRVAIEPRATADVSSTGQANRAAAGIRVDSYLVLIPVLVTDRHDRLVTGLDKTQFRLYEDKVEQVITQFGSEEVPVSVAVVFDCSGSMGAKLEKARMAVAEFLKTANPEDEFALIEFNDRAQVVVGLTTQTEEVQNRLMFSQSKGRTALLDAIYLALNEMQHAKRSRKAILVVSDGGDNSSRYTVSELKNWVREADVQIYSIAIMEPFDVRERTPEEFAGPALLDEIAQQSGGRLYELDNMNQMPSIAARIGLALRHQYMLGYSPTASKRDGKYHRLKVKLEGSKSLTALRAYFRTGYVAPFR